ncbi:PepSY domain-containing protein [Paenibacillus sp. GCM10028914]|uniref:PepSY domain-containing protein n=1 Tax=Paenibacillus sp. GCM10028914 TaxID=3273416 RepID=UPI0036172D95
MNIRRIWRSWIAGIIAIAAIVTLIIWQPWNTKQAMLTAEAAEQVVLNQYPGEIEQTTFENGMYMIQLRSQNGLYQVSLNGSLGTIDSIQQLEKTADAEQKALLSREQVKAELQSSIQGQIDRLELVKEDGEQVYKAVVKEEAGDRKEITLDPYTGETISSKNIPTTPKEDEKDKSARLLTETEASNIALGEISGEVDDVDLRDTDDGIPYYLIDIELKDGREATVEVNAISGAIRSVTWDDDE